VQRHIQDRMYGIMARALHWAPRTTVADSLTAAEPYIRKDLCGEAVLTLGGPTFEHREGHIQGVVSVGPLECMPNKISETQFFHVAEQEGLLSLTLPLNGDPIDIEVLENFVYEVKERFRRQAHDEAHPTPQREGLADRVAVRAGRVAEKLQRVSGAVGRGLLQFGIGRALTSPPVPAGDAEPEERPSPAARARTSPQR
jgi:hypothetical protein